MRKRWNEMLRIWLVYVGVALVLLSPVALPGPSAGDINEMPYCNEGGDPSMPKGCYGWCYSPKCCRTNPIKLVCQCR
ncbi:MAG: hypothetical protein ACLP9L_17965 [Thermoguttaceae bacterium]